MSVAAMLRAAQNHAFGELVSRRMTELGITTLTGLATRMNVTATGALRDVVRGSARPVPKTVKRLAEALEMDVTELSRTLTIPPKSFVEGPPPKPRMEVIPAPVVARDRPKFALSLMPDGTMHLTLDLPHLTPEAAFKLIDHIRISGLFDAG